MTNKIFRNSLIAGLLMSFSLSVSAEETLMTEINGDDLEVHQTDLSHLATGESEIIYTESGKELTLTRTEDGVEVLVDGEKVNTGLHMAEAECKFEVLIETDCDDCEMETHELLALASLDADDINCMDGNTATETSWVSADGSQRMFKRSSLSSNGKLSADEGEVQVIMIHKEMRHTSEEN
ncbi:MAG: hypothetical protein L3J24_08170 [Xanthomonadales bacterium]|nr:hypothetical protein [Xanthomonadales bacterium]